jgi:branched-chain amino acid transport system substrate-binding protein
LKLSARRATVAVALAVAVVFAVSLAGCGAKSDSTLDRGAIRGDSLTIYVSVPRDGASQLAGQAVINGATLELDQNHAHIGRYRIRLDVLDDSAPGSQVWNADAAAAAAQTAAANSTTIGYIGDFNSGASAVSVPILNRLSIPQVSPASSAVGLTSDGPGSSPGEPYAYYPTLLRTFTRVVPSDAVQAQVQTRLQRGLGCQSVYVLDDGEYDGDEASTAFTQVAQGDHYAVVATQSYVPGESSYASIGQTVAQSGADCALVAAIPERSAAALTTAVAQAAPNVQIFATAGLAEPSFTDQALGGLPTKLDSRVLVTAAGGDPSAHNPLRHAFVLAYTRRYGSPLPVAVDGYEAMRLLLGAVRSSTHGGRTEVERVKVVDALHATRHHDSPLGVYSIERNGDTTIDGYGVYRIVNGGLRFWRWVTA